MLTIAHIHECINRNMIHTKYGNNIYIYNGNFHKVSQIDGIDIVSRRNWQCVHSVIVVCNDIKISNCKILTDKNNILIINKSKYRVKNLKINFSENSNVVIGKNFSCHGAQIEAIESKNVMIGDDNQWGYGITIRTGDGHHIYDDTKQRINYGGDVNIKDHVWLCNNVSILKKVNIASGNIVGTNSLVTRNFEDENSIIAGNPAKVIKTKIYWDRNIPL